jgi:hypothetical protein
MKKRIEKSCLNSSQSIFVALLGEHSSASIAQTLFSIFENASCPHRIRVGLYEIIDNEEDASEKYLKLSRKNSVSGLSYENQITIMKRFSSDRGRYGALRELMQHALKDSRFVLTSNDTSLFLQDWDIKLISEIDRFSHTSLILSTSEFPSFTVLSTFEDGMPIVGWRSLHKSAEVAAKFWIYQTSFSTASFWRKMRWQKDSDYLIAGTDVMVTCDALSRGWKFIHSKTNILTLQSTSDNLWTYPYKLTKSSVFDCYKDQLKSLGMVDSFKDAALGVVDDKNEDELNSKYGSRAEYLYSLTKL